MPVRGGLCTYDSRAHISTRQASIRMLCVYTFDRRLPVSDGATRSFYFFVLLLCIGVERAF